MTSMEEECADAALQESSIQQESESQDDRTTTPTNGAETATRSNEVALEEESSDPAHGENVGIEATVGEASGYADEDQEGVNDAQQQEQASADAEEAAPAEEEHARLAFSHEEGEPCAPAPHEEDAGVSSRPDSRAGSASAAPTHAADVAGPRGSSRTSSRPTSDHMSGSRPASQQSGHAAAEAQHPSPPGSIQRSSLTLEQQDRGTTPPSELHSRSQSPQQGDPFPDSEESFPDAHEGQEDRSPGSTPSPEKLEQLPGDRSESRPASSLSSNMKGIDIEIYQGPDLPFKMMRVMIDNSQQQQKSYLGGFKNKRSGAVYHHAWTQTPRAPKYQGVERKLERETQTVKIKQRSIQTTREACTQMERPGVILDTSEDRYVSPGVYQTSEERLAIVVKATLAIQRSWRGYRGRVRAEYLRAKRVEREAFLREQERQAKQEAEEHRRKEIERRMHPRTAADFEILYNELEAWRLQETRKIKQAGLPKDKEQEVLQQLLHKETKLLQTIDRLKINANHENKDVRIQRTLNEMGKPKKFELKNGQTVDVHTPFTTRAMELMQLYNGLNLPMLTIDERLDVLLHVKWTVKEFDCNLTRELVGLIEREADLLNRGRNPKLMEGLRKRISSLFLTFIETPEFNPESSRFQIVPMEFESYLFERLEKSKANVTFGKNTAWDI